MRAGPSSIWLTVSCPLPSKLCSVSFSLRLRRKWAGRCLLGPFLAAGQAATTFSIWSLANDLSQNRITVSDCRGRALAPPRAVPPLGAGTGAYVIYWKIRLGSFFPAEDTRFYGAWLLIWWLPAEAVRGARALRAAAERGPGDLRVQLVQEPARLCLFTRTQRRITRLRRRPTRAGRATAGRRGRRSTGARGPPPTARQAGRSGRRFRRLPAAPTPATLGRPRLVGLGR